ncbi:MAG: sugar phosphate isomerase/epimerase [Candidatus Thorarchaeota archaeon]|nr:MAG: sugar phosphate isomerase/epimerase [Candidatus Thorarchaeota archaeon]
MSMRFGIVAIEFIPALKRVIAGDAPDFSRINMVEIVREAAAIEHIQAIEIPMEIEHMVPGSLTPDVISELGELKDELDLSYTAHLPFWAVELTSFNDYIRSGSVDSNVHSIKLVEDLEPEAYVLHSTGALAAEYSRQGFSESVNLVVQGYMNSFAMRSVEEIISKSEVNPLKLAIENVEFPFDFTRDIVDELNTSICFDTGHLLTKQCGDESLSEFYREHSDRITEIHLNDGLAQKNEAGGHQDHLVLGTGDMPVREFLLELVKDKFEGPLVFEMPHEDAIESLSAIRNLVPEALQ